MRMVPALEYTIGSMVVVFRFGHGLYFPFSSIYFHNVLGIPLSLVGVGLAVFAGALPAAGGRSDI